jgi:hypothetical protein
MEFDFMGLLLAGGIACWESPATPQRSSQDWSEAELAEHAVTRAQGLESENGVAP